jgi:hypothetical protein
VLCGVQHFQEETAQLRIPYSTEISSVSAEQMIFLLHQLLLFVYYKVSLHWQAPSMN